MKKHNYFPLKLQQDELFKKFLEEFKGFTSSIDDSVGGVVNKYNTDINNSVESVREIFKEMGLESIADLLDYAPNVDFASVLAFANAISLLKGSDEGYFLVLDLLNFSYEAIPWHEQVPRGELNTFSFDVDLDASMVESPYETFQKIKAFTNDYLLPVFYPLGYSYNVQIEGVGISAKGSAHKIVGYETHDEEAFGYELYGRSGFVLENGPSNVKIKINSNGGYKAFETETEFTTRYWFEDSLGDFYEVKVDSNGNLFTELINIPSTSEFYKTVIEENITLVSYLMFVDGLGKNWLMTVEQGVIDITDNFNLLPHAPVTTILPFNFDGTTLSASDALMYLPIDISEVGKWKTGWAVRLYDPLEMLSPTDMAYIEYVTVIDGQYYIKLDRTLFPTTAGNFIMESSIGTKFELRCGVDLELYTIEVDTLALVSSSISVLGSSGKYFELGVEMDGTLTFDVLNSPNFDLGSVTIISDDGKLVKVTMNNDDLLETKEGGDFEGYKIKFAYESELTDYQKENYFVPEI